MSIYHMTGEKLQEFAGLFSGWEETLIWSCLQGCMGSAWADHESKPEAGQIVVGDFCFFAGIPSKELVSHKPAERESDFVIMVPQNEGWERMIEEVYQENAKKVTRYAIKKEPDIFDQEKLKALLNCIKADYEIRLIDEELYHKVLGTPWSKDLCSQFNDYSMYRDHGLGVVILHGSEIVAGASSYTVYQGGIEIEIDTREDYRRQGLASICGASLILECLKRDLYPSWDAQNPWSVALAEKLGYHFDREYTAYEVTSFGQRG